MENKNMSRSEAGMVVSHELTCLRDDEDTLGLLLPGLTCPTMICRMRTRATERTWAGSTMGMTMTELETIMTGGVGRETAIVSAEKDGLSGP